ncbi:hypothetical protein ACG7TL_006164 [Trametes sanguinea]
MSPGLSQSRYKFDPRRFGQGQTAAHEGRKQVRFEQDDSANDQAVASSAPASHERTQTSDEVYPVRTYNIGWLATSAIIIYLFIRDGWAASIASGTFPPFHPPWSLNRNPADQQSVSPTLAAHIEEVVFNSLLPVPLRDYALAADGGMVFDELTWSFPGFASSPPELVLEDDMRVGRCWRFTGSRGQIAISLPVFIHPTHVSIDHIPRAIAADVGQAPRRMTLWGVIDGFENQERDHPPLTKDEYIFVELADFVYNVTQVRPVQTFALREEVRQLGIDIGLVVLEIMDNWGSPPRRTISRASLPQRSPSTPRIFGEGFFEVVTSDSTDETSTVIGSKRSARPPELVNEKNRREQEEDWARPLLPKDPPPVPRTQIRRRKLLPQKTFTAEQIQAIGKLWTQYARSPAIPDMPEHVQTSAGSAAPTNAPEQQQHQTAAEAAYPPQQFVPPRHPGFDGVPPGHAMPQPPPRGVEHQVAPHYVPGQQPQAPHPPPGYQGALPGYQGAPPGAPPPPPPGYHGALPGAPPPPPPGYQGALPGAPLPPPPGYQGAPPGPPFQRAPPNWPVNQQRPPSHADAHAQGPHHHGQAYHPPQYVVAQGPYPTAAQQEAQRFYLAQDAMHRDPIPAIPNEPQYAPPQHEVRRVANPPLAQPLPQSAPQPLYFLHERHPGHGDPNPPQPHASHDTSAGPDVLHELLLRLHPSLRQQVLASLTSPGGTGHREDDAMELEGPQAQPASANTPKAGAAHAMHSSLRNNGAGPNPHTRPPDGRPDTRTEDMDIDQNHEPRPDKGKQRAVPVGVASNGHAPQSTQPNLASLLIDQVQTFHEDLRAQSRLQQDLVKAVKGLGNKLGRLENGSPLSGGQASQSTPSSQKTTPVFTRPKRSARASKAMSVRTQLARYEQEDFTAELDAVMSEDEGPSPTTSPTKTARAATNRYTRHFGVQHAVPRIPVTTQQEEALMIRAMSKEEKQDVERTFILRLQLAIRLHLLHLLKVASLDEIGARFPSLTDEELDAYQQAPSPYINTKNFRIDFKRGWKRCSFNREASTFFVQHFLESVAGGLYRSPPIPSRYFTPTQVELALDSHMDHARTKWKEHVKPAPKHKVENRVEQKRISSRQKTLHVARCYVLQIYKLDDHAALLAKLEPRHMSGDEAKTATDRLVGIFVIIEAAWQSAEIKTFLRQLDILYAIEYMKPSGGRLRSGKAPRQRIVRPDGRTVDSAAPVGLWRNCYDQAWLGRQRPHFIKGLEIIDEDYDFSLDMDAALNRRNENMEVEVEEPDGAGSGSGDDEEEL